MKRVLIAIQARSTSTRLPNKVNLQIGGKTLLQYVIDSCKRAVRFLDKLDISVSVCLVVPQGDPIVTIYRNGQVPIVEGDENDVLSRYVKASELFEADYVVRITADCLFIPPHHIHKHVKAAVTREKDYTSNTHFRTHKEGWDCEVLSRRLLEWLDDNATTAEDREHVTSLIAHGKPFPFMGEDGKQSICHIMSFYDESDDKTSIDTQEEYERAVKRMQSFQVKTNEARKHGTYIS